MTRLTNTLRETMARRLVAHRYADELAALKTLNETLFDRVYKYLYPDDVRAAMELVKDHFPSEFGQSNWLRVNAGGLFIQVGGYTSNQHIKIHQDPPPPHRLVVSAYHTHSITGDEELTNDIQEFARRKDTFDTDCHTAFNEALAVLNAIGTVKRLAVAWPEAMPVIGDLIPDADRSVPVVQVATINAKFGLPPEAQAA